jgi:hypothetical protein
VGDFRAKISLKSGTIIGATTIPAESCVIGLITMVNATCVISNNPPEKVLLKS